MSAPRKVKIVEAIVFCTNGERLQIPGDAVIAYDPEVGVLMVRHGPPSSKQSTTYIGCSFAVTEEPLEIWTAD